jgi:predicted flap endonuclease-1-like 5' DNA nuclease
MIPLLGEIWFWTLLSTLLGLGIGWWIWHNNNMDRVSLLEGELNMARRSADDASASRTRVEKELAESNAKIMPLMNSNTSYTSEIERLKRELATSRSDDAADDSEIARLRKALDAARTASQNGETEIARLQKEMTDMKGNMATLASQNAASKSEIEALKRDLAAARSDDLSDDATIRRLTEELSATRATLANSEAEAARMRGMLVSTESELMTFKADLAKQNEKLPLFLDAPRGVPDDLRLIKGIGDKLNALLTNTGIFHFRQIANWDAGEIQQVDAKLEIFKGRIVRDDWVAQAKLLASGKHDEFERIYGKMGENN